jgi:hypothetical protein
MDHDKLNLIKMLNDKRQELKRIEEDIALIIKELNMLDIEEEFYITKQGKKYHRSKTKLGLIRRAFKKEI